MRATRTITVVVSVLLVLSLTGCGKAEKSSLSAEAQNVCGSWAYIHDRETAVAIFRENGTAEYEDARYSFECEDGFIVLTDKKGNTTKLRYELDADGMLLYRNTTYSFSGEGQPDGLVGQWTCPETNWTFEFTGAGTFLEDGYFPGIYTVDEQNQVIKLIYNDQFEDTTCYYSLGNDTLNMEYPWRMVKTDSK